MAVAIASQLGKQMGGEQLFSDISFKLEPRQRMTLSGRNGAGKSTLLRVLAGELAPDQGGIRLQKGCKVALHDQRPPREGTMTLREYILEGRREMLELEAELTELEQRMSSDADEATLTAYSEVQARFETAGGYRWRDGVLAVLNGLGFNSEQYDRRLETFSGGELTRASLARALATEPELLLLDEPTNHLDIPSLEWLEQHLTSIDAAIVLVAHDRWFLESVGTAVLELEAGKGRFFNGPWHAWRKEQAARELALGRAIERQEAEIERMERFVERFRYKATKAKQAQARVKQIDRMKTEGPIAERRDDRKLRFSFAPPERPGRFVLKVQDLRVEVPGRVLLEDASLQIERGEHVTLVGPNGAGKTSLIETLAGRREPAAGQVKLGHNVQLGYLGQHSETASGIGTILEACQRETGLTGQKARDLLGGFMFSGREVEKQLSDISGGEQRRLSLAILVASGANVLILDEPTNHLDVESREALEDALLEYEGAVILISHDRALLEAVGSRTLVVEGGKLRSFPNGWADYARMQEERLAAERQVAQDRKAAVAEERSNGADPGEPQALSKNARKKIAGIERRIEVAEQELKKVEDELADPSAWSSPGRSKRATQRHAEAKQEIERLYESLERAGG